jgi:simple sugar transport system permease protein
LNPGAAEYAGVRTGVAQVQAFAGAGALAGLGGVSYVLGYKHFFEQDFTAGAGFMGIAVALIGRSQPLGVLVAALFFGALAYGGLVVNQRVPSDLVNVLRALVILFAISAHALFARWARRSAA